MSADPSVPAGSLEQRIERIAARAVSGAHPEGQIEYEIAELIADALAAQREALAAQREALQVIHKTVRGDEHSECWTIRKWLDEHGIFNDDIQGGKRLIEECCKAALSAFPEGDQHG